MMEALSLWTRSGFEDFVAQTLDRHPERLSTSVIFVNDQYFFGGISHWGVEAQGMPASGNGAVLVFSSRE
jgi:hypothetical protein